jgi:hypothetical protein
LYRVIPTMTNQSSRPPGDGVVPPAAGVQYDDASDVTPPSVRGVNRNEHERVEITVKFRFLGKNRKGEAIDPAKVHLHWIRAVQDHFGTEVQVMNNNGQVMPKVDTVRWSTTHHAKYFNVHNSVSRSRVGVKDSSKSPSWKGPSSLIIHRIRSSATLQEIKQAPRILDLLQ